MLIPAEEYPACPQCGTMMALPRSKIRLINGREVMCEETNCRVCGMLWRNPDFAIGVDEL